MLFVVDGLVEAGCGDRYILDILSHCKTSGILGINKIDTQRAVDAQMLDITYARITEANQWKTVRFSALTGDGLVRHCKFLALK